MRSYQTPVINGPDDEFERAVAVGATRRLGVEYWEKVLDGIYRGTDHGAARRMAEMRQARIAEASDRITVRYNEVLGLPQYKVDPWVYHTWAWQFRDGNDVPDYECWNEDGWIREWLRDNPESRVKMATGGATNRVGWRSSLTPALTPPPPQTGSKSKSESRNKTVVLTDKRGNAE